MIYFDRLLNWAGLTLINHQNSGVQDLDYVPRSKWRWVPKQMLHRRPWVLRFPRFIPPLKLLPCHDSPPWVGGWDPQDLRSRWGSTCAMSYINLYHFFWKGTFFLKMQPNKNRWSCSLIYCTVKDCWTCVKICRNSLLLVSIEILPCLGGGGFVAFGRRRPEWREWRSVWPNKNMMSRRL